MYEPIISKMATQAIRNLHPEVVLAVQRKTLFSKAEQDLLGTIKANPVSIEGFFCFSTINHSFPPESTPTASRLEGF